MYPLMNGARFVFVTLTLLACAPIWAGRLMPITYLTFEKEDTSRHMTVNFIVEGQSQTSWVYYDVVSHKEGSVRDYAFKARTRVQGIKKVKRTYHHGLLDNLKPNTVYYFRVGDESMGTSREYKMRTLPNDRSAIRLLVGGDMSVNDKIVETALGAIKEEPHAIIIGGDIAYANGRVKDEIKWIRWFEKMEKIMISPQGFLTPLILAIGNHETTIGIHNPLNKVTFFFKLFNQNGKKAFFKRRLGNHTGLVVLDSGHNELHRKQKKFLKKALKSYAGLNHRLAAYHAPLYPNHRSVNGLWAKRGRRHWGPLFDRYRLSVAFEHHDHTLKRTYVLRDEKIAKKGTVYVGDGCWGKNGREANEKWYLKKSTEDTHVWLATIDPEKITLKALGAGDEVYDHFEVRNYALKTEVREL